MVFGRIINRHLSSSISNLKSFDEIPRANGFIERILPISPQFLRLGGPPYLHKHIDERHKQLGEIFREKMGPFELISITDTNMIRTVIKNEGKFPETKIPPAWALYMKIYNLERGLFFQRSEKWFSTRRSLDKILLDSNKIDKFTQISWTIANDLLDSWEGAQHLEGHSHASNSKSFELSDFAHDLSKWSMENVGYMLFGQRLGCIEAEDVVENIKSLRLVDLANNMLELSEKLQILPVDIMQKLNTNVWIKFKQSMDELMLIAREISRNGIDHAKTNQNVGLVHDMVSTGGLDEEDLIKNLIDFLIAASDTSAASVTWALYLLGKNPDIQQEARNEVIMHRDSIQQDNGDTSWTDFNERLKYLDGFIREVMRLYPPAPFISRQLPSDVVLGDYQVPAGVHVIFPLITTGRMESHFEDSSKVKPERWFVSNNKESVKTSDDKMASLPFGLGRRMCIGRKMASLEIKMFLAALLSRYEVQLVDDTPVDIRLRLTTWPDKPLKIRLIPITR